MGALLGNYCPYTRMKLFYSCHNLRPSDFACRKLYGRLQTLECNETLVLAWSTPCKKESRRLRFWLLLGQILALTKNGTISPRKVCVIFEVWLGVKLWISTTLSSPKFCPIPGNREVFKMSRYFFVPMFNPVAIKCGFMTLSSFSAPNTIREVGFFVWNTGGMSEGLYAITRQFVHFTSVSTGNIFSSTNTKAFRHLHA